MVYIVADKFYSTKEEIKIEAQRILNKSVLGSKIEGDDYLFLLSLFQIS